MFINFSSILEPYAQKYNNCILKFIMFYVDFYSILEPQAQKYIFWYKMVELCRPKHKKSIFDPKIEVCILKRAWKGTWFIGQNDLPRANDTIKHDNTVYILHKSTYFVSQNLPSGPARIVGPHGFSQSRFMCPSNEVFTGRPSPPKRRRRSTGYLNPVELLTEFNRMTR